MSQIHLTTGSEEPPKVDGKLRLYSMEYCPYAQRARLVLKAKNIPHDIVNINLINKPEWYFKINPKGLVPALDTGSEVVVESLDICNFLDEKYPDNPLYPEDAAAKQRDKELIEKISALIDVFTKIIIGKEKKSAEEWAKEFTPHLEILENELATRGTLYFGGDKPGMVDYMLWPWGERAGVIAIALQERLPFGDDQFPLMRKWRKSMRDHPICSEMYHGPEKFWKIIEMKLKKIPADYESI